MQSLPSFTTTSLTSPLLATPTNKSRQKSTTSATMPLANYYQLPKWTVDITNISAVSVLKPSSSSNKMKLAMLSSSQKQARCFCVRTFDGNCYIMKAQKQKDLERWLFVLTKMWKFAQAMKHQLMPQQPQHQQIIRQQQQIRVGTHTPPLQQTQYSSSFLTPHHRLQSQDSIPLSHMYQRPRHTSLTCPHLPLETGNAMNTTLPMVKPQVMSASSSSQASAPAPVTGHPPPKINKPSLAYEERYQHPTLSVEKMECIDAWRQSLDELMASDPQLGVTSPPPIESLPDDDMVSVISDMTSISHRKKPTSNNLRRRTSVTSSKASKRSSSRSSNNKLKAHHHPTPSLSLKKKRSNDVKNWIEPRKADPYTTTVTTSNPHVLPSPSPSPVKTIQTSSSPVKTIQTSPSPVQTMQISPSPAKTIQVSPSHIPPIDTYHVPYFQDCKTTTRSTSSASLDLKDDSPDDENQNKFNTTMLDRHAKYHSSTRAKQIQMVNGPSCPPPSQTLDKTTPSSSTDSSHRRKSYPPVQSQSPPVGRRSSGNDSTSMKQPQQHPPPSFLADSPLYSLAHVDQRKHQDEEEISLADLQRSLKRASLQQQQHQSMANVASPSSPVVPPLRHQSHAYAQHFQPYQHPYHSSSSVSVTAPAIPPMPYTMNNMPFLSSGGSHSGSDKDMTADFYRQQNRVWKKQMEQQQQQQQRPKSWMPSCEQKNVMQQRRSVHLDTVHW
ncbi:unnamed protein product [Absidia cylindrospora]